MNTCRGPLQSLNIWTCILSNWCITLCSCLHLCICLSPSAFPGICVESPLSWLYSCVSQFAIFSFQNILPFSVFLLTVFLDEPTIHLKLVCLFPSSSCSIYLCNVSFVHWLCPYGSTTLLSGYPVRVSNVVQLLYLFHCVSSIYIFKINTVYHHNTTNTYDLLCNLDCIFLYKYI